MINETLKLKINNLHFHFHKFGGLYIEEHDILIISDLHFGKGISFLKMGYSLPPFDANDTLYKLETVINFFLPKKVISLGDNFHEKNSFLKMNKETIIQINMLAKKFNFLWITGNHDYNLEKSRIYGEIKKQFMMKNLIFKHIFTKLIKKKKFEFSGHFHPKFSQKYNGVYYNYKCFVLGNNFCILPSFGTYTGGLDISSNELKKILNGHKIELIIIGERKIIKRRFNDTN